MLTISSQEVRLDSQLSAAIHKLPQLLWNVATVSCKQQQQ
jgi:hypothetical protein